MARRMKDISTTPIWARIEYITRTRGITRGRQYALIASGDIEASKDGRATVVKVASVDAYLDRNRVTKFPGADEMRRRRKVGIEREQAARCTSPPVLDAASR
jgi:hypothetical protein